MLGIAVPTAVWSMAARNMPSIAAMVTTTRRVTRVPTPGVRGP